MRVLGRLALLNCGLALLASSTEAVSSAVTTPPPESAWGRIYLQRGLAPIQYFRDRYGGPMLAHDVEFYFPRRSEDRSGCQPLPDDEQHVLQAANGTMVLVVDRGECTFEDKSRHAEAMGAGALVIVSEDESAKSPIAHVDPGEIQMPTVMIRKSAGDLLRSVTAREPKLTGRLVPIVCERKPYACIAQRPRDKEFIAVATGRSGVIVSETDQSTIGQFLAATFGGVLPSYPLHVTSLEGNGCAALEGAEVQGKAVVVSEGGECSALEKISNVQRAGADVALLSTTQGITHPVVAEAWLGYNITIVAASIDEDTTRRLREMTGKVSLRTKNDIATAWEEIHRLSMKSAWPARRDRREKMLKRLLATLSLDSSQLSALKHQFLTVAEGSNAAWDQLVPSEDTQSSETLHDDL
ncbi:hypothetical protein Poli38472_012257 [Pythium oligandrum]|uniref:PA domain-containing protein n=1 Tax=Pythium oligandrum TaxID=41045 RepID=A0A8K1FLH2_PYTOL|nr:hypothetical protein Poli38472_012257 [Pythium oligandrum]|eukprot:TMW67141.1 hypothetical protein Poli38472_012257 [Pythium oligandrum]